MRLFTTFLFLAALCLTASMLSACTNTAAGFGRDLETTGKKIQTSVSKPSSSQNNSGSNTYNPTPSQTSGQYQTQPSGY